MKRDGEVLNADAIQAFVDAVTDGGAPDYQISALLMAIFLNGMDAQERGLLTRAMTHSGDVLKLDHLGAARVDKHSTGGVGDKVSICLAPAVAACGIFVPMVSGRGLGHTGGTLDKLESIPGLRTRLETDEFLQVLQKCGYVMGGQSSDIAPADKKLYSLRDVTSTVESLPLIASSIMSKKLAEGISGLVLDVKMGDGAFMKTIEDARALALALVETGEAVDVKTTAFITDMDQPLGLAIGNANEMREALEVMHGGGPSDLVELTVLLGGEMLLLGGVADSLEHGKDQIQASFADGSALEKMRQMVVAQGGDTRVVDDPGLLAEAPHAADVCAPQAGFVTGFRTEALGRAVIALGGGRNTAEDVVDPSVGIDLKAKRGDAVAAGAPLARVTATNEATLRAVLDEVARCIHVGPDAPAAVPLVHEELRL
jgi:pyrimidine-nucleoside phosphorylase